MPKVQIKKITKKFISLKGEKITALDNVDLVIHDKKYNTLLGPSGCGKTTLLRIITGLIEPTEGRVYFNDKDMTDVTVQDRDIGFVFQHFSIFPHLDVWYNTAYGPLVRGWREKDIIKTTNPNEWMDACY